MVTVDRRDVYVCDVIYIIGEHLRTRAIRKSAIAVLGL
jgi:hypothetical protein